MGTRIRNHIRGNVVGYVAVFFALSGSAYAAATVGSTEVIDNSLTSDDLKNGAAVRSADVVDDTVGGGLGAADLRSGSVGNSEVINASLGGAKITNNSLTGDDVSAIGGRDIVDSTVTGTDVNEATLGLVQFNTHTFEVAPDAVQQQTLHCLGNVPVGAGYWIREKDTNAGIINSAYVFENQPFDDDDLDKNLDSWRIGVHNNQGTYTAKVTITVACLESAGGGTIVGEPPH